MHFANPVPEADAIPSAQIEGIIEEALSQADRAGITGAANTPFVLNAIKELSHGASVKANRALIEANVIRGTRLAVELSKLDRGEDLSELEGLDGLIPASAYSVQNRSYTKPVEMSTAEKEHEKASVPNLTSKISKEALQTKTTADILVVGSVALDLTCDYTPLTHQNDPIPRMETSNPASMHQSIGGVGYNVARAISLAGGSAEFISIVGNDAASEFIDKTLLDMEAVAAQLQVLEHKTTAQYVAINDTNKNLVLGMADMSIFNMPDGEDHLPVVWSDDSSFKW